MKKLGLIFFFLFLFIFFSKENSQAACVRYIGPFCVETDSCKQKTAPCTVSSDCCQGLKCEFGNYGEGASFSCVDYTPYSDAELKSRPPAVRRGSATGDTINIVWDDDPRIRSYFFSYHTGDNNYIRSETTSGSRSSYQLKNLDPNSTYTVYVEACNDTTCVASNYLDVKTVGAAPTCLTKDQTCDNSKPNGGCCDGYICPSGQDMSDYGGPVIVGKCMLRVGIFDEPPKIKVGQPEVIDIRDDKATVIWKATDDANSYNVKYVLKGEFDAVKDPRERHYGVKENVYPPKQEIDKLLPNAIYVVQVEGCNNKGCSTQSLSDPTEIQAGNPYSYLSAKKPTPSILPPAPCSKYAYTLDPKGTPYPYPSNINAPEVPSPRWNDPSIQKTCVQLGTGVGYLNIAPNEFVSQLFTIILGVVGGIAFLLFIYSGYILMTSAGNKEKVQGARDTITSAIAGLLFIIFSVALLEIIGIHILKIPGWK